MDIRIPGIPPRLFKIEFSFTGNDDDCPFPYLPGHLKPAEATKADKSTSRKSITRTSATIQGLSRLLVPEDLQRIKISASLWSNFVYYADPTRSQPAANFDRNTLEVAPNNETEANPRCTAFGVMSMYWHSLMYAWQSDDGIDIVNSQQSSRDSMFRFIVWFTRWAIMVCSVPSRSFRSLIHFRNLIATIRQ